MTIFFVWSSVLTGAIHLETITVLESTAKLFADDLSLFLTVHDPNISANRLDSDLRIFLDIV